MYLQASADLSGVSRRTDFVYDAAVKFIFPTQEELTSLTTLRKLKADAGHMLPPYNGA